MFKIFQVNLRNECRKSIKQLMSCRIANYYINEWNKSAEDNCVAVRYYGELV